MHYVTLLGSLILTIMLCSTNLKAEDKTIHQAYYYFSLGEKAMMDNQPELAIENFKLASSFDPSSAHVRAKLAEAYLKKDNAVAAMENIKTAITLDPKYVYALQIYTEILISQKLYDEALKTCNNILSIDPKHKETIHYKAIILVELNRNEEALKTLFDFAGKDVQDELTSYYIALIYEEMGNKIKAEEYFKKTLGLAPRFELALIGLISLYDEEDNQENTLRKLNELFVIYPENLSLAKKIASMYLDKIKNSTDKIKLKKLYQKVLTALKNAEELDQSDLSIKFKIALLEVELQNYDNATLILRDILKQDPESDKARYYLGAIYEEKREYLKAIEEFRKIKDSSYLYEESRIHVAYLYKLSKDFPNSIKIMEEAILKQPKNPRLYDFYASIYEAKGETGRAIEVLESASKIFPSNERIIYYLGSLYDKVKNTDKAVEKMNKILELNPNNPNALNYIGYTYTEKNKNLEEAKRLISRALELIPDDPYIIDSMGWIYFKMGDINSAIVQLEKAKLMLKKKGMTEPVILEHLAQVYKAMGLAIKARETYQQILSLEISSDKKKEINETLSKLNEESRMPASIPVKEKKGIKD